MIILDRIVGESLIIGDEIKVKVMGTNRGYQAVQLGVDAPQDIFVHREEVYEAIQQEKTSR